MLSNYKDITAKLNRLVNEAKSLRPHLQHKGPGRPNQHIRSTYHRVETYLPPDLVAAIDAIAASRVTRTGRPAPRVDVIREAIEAFVRPHLPEAGL